MALLAVENQSAEWLSKYRKTSKLIPVITFVFYYNAEAWDGSLDLYNMLDFGEDLEIADLFKKTYFLVSEKEYINLLCRSSNQYPVYLRHENPIRH